MKYSLLKKGLSLKRVTWSQLNLLARAYPAILKLAYPIADLTGSEEIQPVLLAEALHAPQPSEVDNGVRLFIIKSTAKHIQS